MSDEAERIKRRNFHRNRAIVAKIAKEPSLHDVEHMTHVELWRLIYRMIADGREVSLAGGDPRMARIHRDLSCALVELHLRGVQLQLPAI